MPLEIDFVEILTKIQVFIGIHIGGWIPGWHRKISDSDWNPPAEFLMMVPMVAKCILTPFY